MTMISAASEGEAGPVSRPRLGLRQWAARTNWVLGLILLAWFVLVIVPLAVLFSFSFFETKSYFTIYRPSLNTWISLFESGRFEVTLRTLRIALTVTLIELLVAYPFALWLAKGCRSKTLRAVLIALLTIPFFLDTSSRTIIWRAILGQNGLVNSLLMQAGLTDAPVEWLLYSEVSVHFGLVVSLFPPMALPIYMAIGLIDDELIKASDDLGATPWQTFSRIVLPLSLPGVMAGVVFTLGPALAAWVEPGMLGGGFVNLLSNSIESAYTALRYPVVAALSTFVILLLLALLGAMMLVARRFGDLSSSFRVLKG
ncbi:ABC transporter permease [Rubellimicrobium aerolatum]|uniref:ABC transporter permease n=1 Tax=Rubellimicrobium aerolatum TaxID=490979 RepID=A0ABW0SGR6_9RHOB|nr:ABC transporter permease [Rubellimicrobium aerolatum]MBP1807508.1 ABC-type spermidine/putrescine transport system permease subunit I [Rubellimicrobium aerolatum]